MDLSSIKWCLSAAGPFPAKSIKELESIIGEGNFIELYGMTETSPVTCCNPRYGKKNFLRALSAQSNPRKFRL